MGEPICGHRPARRARVPLPLIVGAFALLCAGSAAASVRVQVFNFSPRTEGNGGALSFDLGGQATVNALPYKGQTQFLTLANPSFELRVTDESGALLFTQQLNLTDRRDHVIAAAGDGIKRPFIAYQGLQHADITPENGISLQVALLSLQGDFNDPVDRRRSFEPCDAPAPAANFPNPNPTPRYDGYAAFDPSYGTTRSGSCIRVHQSAVHSDGRSERLSIEFGAEPGERIRVFAIGDGVRQPYEQMVVRYGIEPTLPTVSPNASMEGLWYDPERPGEGLAVLYDSSTTPRRTRLFYYGYDAANRNTWGATPTGGTVVLETFRGGSPDGQQVTSSDPVGSLFLRFHSCRDASFVSNAPNALIRHTDFDRTRARRLVKLLPLDNCAS